jgi:anti-sigma regulatory factor (Ser/Thr protein kinase)
MSQPTSLHLEVTVDEKDLRLLSSRLWEFLNRHTLPLKAIYNAELVLEEMVCNVLRYGHAETIAFTVRVDSGALWITITDNGVPFDPTAAPPAEIPDSAATASIGGLGIHMVKNAVDKMVYHRIGKENRLEIRIDTEAPSV